jgi:hypothetical protein
VRHGFLSSAALSSNLTREVVSGIVTQRVIGGRRVGKTSLLKRLWSRNLVQMGCRTLYHDCEDTLTYDDFLGSQDLDWQPGAPAGNLKSLGDVLSSPPNDKPLVLLLDEADKLLPHDRAADWKLFRRLRALSQSGKVQFILGGERSLREALRDPIGPLFNFPNEILLGPLNFSAVRELITLPMGQLKVKFEEETKVVQLIYDFTSGHPNIVQGLCERLVRQLTELGTRSIGPEQVDSIIRDPGFLRDDYLTTYWEAATCLEKIITLIMANDKNLHSEDMIRQVLAGQYNLRPRAGEISGALQRLVGLRSILSNTSDGYEFAAKEFPRLVSKTITSDDMLKDLIQEYQEKG